MLCRECGADVNSEAVFCHKCGARIAAEDLTQPDQPAASHAREESGKERLSARFATGQPGQADPSKTDDQEDELWEGGFSPKAMIGSWIGAGLATVAGLVLGVITFPAGMFSWLILFALVAAMWIFLLGKLAYRRLSVSYKLTSQRFVHQTGILSRTTDRIEVIDMDDITFNQGLVQRMVNVGTIRITSSDRTHPELVLLGIDNVNEVSQLLDNARRKERTRRGVHIEAI